VWAGGARGGSRFDGALGWGWGSWLGGEGGLFPPGLGGRRVRWPAGGWGGSLRRLLSGEGGGGGRGGAAGRAGVVVLGVGGGCEGMLWLTPPVRVGPPFWWA